VNCWLVNTGWVGGPYGIGHRISIKQHARAPRSRPDGALLDVEYQATRSSVPRAEDVPGVPDAVLRPAESWSNKELYDQKYRQLAARFIENFRKFEDGCPEDVIAAGPKL